MEKENIKASLEEAELLLELNPEGDKYHVQALLNFKMGYYHNSELITFDYIYDKYKNYLLWWKSKHGTKEEKYIPKNDKLRNIPEFISESMYLNNFNNFSRIDSRTSYIFGNISKIKQDYEKYYPKQ